MPFAASITRAVVLCDGRCKATFSDGGVLVLSRDARDFCVAAGVSPRPPPAAAAAAAPPAAAAAAAAELHVTALALRRHRPYLAQALAVRNAHPPTLTAGAAPAWWRPYEPAWLRARGGGGDDDSGGGGGGDRCDAESASAAAAPSQARTELAACCLASGSSSNNNGSSVTWWLDPRAELPPPGGQRAPLPLPPPAPPLPPPAVAVAAAVLWTPRATLSLVLPPPPPPLPPATPSAGFRDHAFLYNTTSTSTRPAPVIEAEARVVGLAGGGAGGADPLAGGAAAAAAAEEEEEDALLGDGAARASTGRGGDGDMTDSHQGLYKLRTVMGGRFFEQTMMGEGGGGGDGNGGRSSTGDAAPPESGGSRPPAAAGASRLYASSALPDRLKGVAMRLLQMRSAAADALAASAAASAAAAPPPPEPTRATQTAAPRPTTTTHPRALLPGLGEFAADPEAGVVRAALADGTLVHLFGGQARVTLADGRLCVVPRRGGGGAAAALAASGAASFFGGSGSGGVHLSPPPMSTPATVAAAVALAEDFAAWALAAPAERERWRRGAEARAVVEAGARAAARTADAFASSSSSCCFLPPFVGRGGGQEEDADHDAPGDGVDEYEDAVAAGVDVRGAVQRTLRLNSDALALLEGAGGG